MPGKLITELAELFDAVDTDELEIQTIAGFTNKITKANLLKTVTDSIAAHLATYNPHAAVKWKGQWQAIQYLENDMAVEGDYLGVANKTTTDRLAPQNVGAPVEFVDKTVVAAEAEFVGVIKTEHDFTITSEGFIEELWLHTPYFDVDSVVRLTVQNITRGTAQVTSGIILKSTEWVLLQATNTFFSPGDLGTITLEQYNASAANNIDGGWNSATGTGEPVSQQFNLDSLTVPTTMGINHTDLDSTNRSTELDGVTVDSRIYISETGDAARNIELKVTAIDTTSTVSTRYTVEVVNNVPNDIRIGKVCSVSIDVPITQPTRYTVFTGEAATPPSFASVVTSVFYDNVKQPDTTDAYGISVTFQPAVSSPDWDIAAVTGASGVNSGFIEHDLDAHTDVASASATEGQMLTYQTGIWTPAPVSPTGYKNVIINGRLGAAADGSPPLWNIDQRDFAGGYGGNWSSLPEGDYGYDRWRKPTAVEGWAGLIEQRIELNNVIDGATYVLSWEGSGTTNGHVIGTGNQSVQGLSPLGPFTIYSATGQLRNYVQVILPPDAYNVQLELGSAPTNFEIRPQGPEEQLCQRYYYEANALDIFFAPKYSPADNLSRTINFYLPVKMRISSPLPTVTVAGLGTPTLITVKDGLVLRVVASADSPTSNALLQTVKVDAEIT